MESANTADLIFVGGTILTIDQAQPTAEALAVRDGRITAVGDRATVLASRGASTEVVELGGRTLMPGLIESHGHPVATAVFLEMFTNIQPFTTPDLASLDRAINKRVAAARPGDYVTFFGLDPVLQEGVTVPTLAQMDCWAPGNPLVILANSGHAAYGNTIALQRAGVTAATPDPTGGQIVHAADGSPTGECREVPAVGILLAPVVGGGSPRAMVGAVRTYLGELAAVGITAVSDHSYNPDTAPLYAAAASMPDCSVRVRAYEIGRPDGSLSRPPNSGDDMFRLIGVKYWADGSPWQGNIAESVPYLNTPVTQEKMGLEPNHCGDMNYSRAQIADEVSRFFPLGYQFAIHAHGDIALDIVLDVYEEQLQATPRPDHRPRIEHCGCMTDAQFARAATLGVTVSLFMTHVYDWGDVLHDSMFPAAIADRWAAAGSAQRAGVRFTFHNDGFVSPALPLLNIQTAVTRKTKSGRVLGPEQAITAEQALRGHTIDAAYQLFMEDIAGSLEVGKVADLVILAENPLAVEPDRIGAIGIEATYLNGCRVSGRA